MWRCQSNANQKLPWPQWHIYLNTAKRMQQTDVSISSYIITHLIYTKIRILLDGRKLLFAVTVGGDHQILKRISLLKDQKVSSSQEVVLALVYRSEMVAALPRLPVFPPGHQQPLL